MLIQEKSAQRMGVAIQKPIFLYTRSCYFVSKNGIIGQERSLSWKSQTGIGPEMEVTSKIVLFLLIGAALCSPAQNEVLPTADAIRNKSPEEILTYRGMSDASAAAAVDEETFIVADDENNILRVYKIKGSRFPVYQFDLTRFLKIAPEHPEADIEGAAMIGDTIYWISSHGRNKDGKMRPNRYRFFATSVRIENGNITIRPVGIPCRTLIHSLVKSHPARQLGLGRATRFDSSKLSKQELENLAPKRNGLNIEGLCAAPDGNTIYIGFRNPRPFVERESWRAPVESLQVERKAIVVPLNNPKQVLEKGYPPIFGDPILWDLGGLGIRSLDYSHFHKAFFIIAGPHNEGPGFALYRWSGEKDKPPVLVQQLRPDKNSLNPEALISFKNSDKFLLLSDDGSLAIKVSSPGECEEGELNEDGTCPNKYLSDQNKKSFRGICLTP
jgi:hypothetical protein